MPCPRQNDAIPIHRRNRLYRANYDHHRHKDQNPKQRAERRSRAANPHDRQRVLRHRQRRRCPRQSRNPRWSAAPAPHANGRRVSAECHRPTTPLPTPGRVFRRGVSAGDGYLTVQSRLKNRGRKIHPGMRKSVPWLQVRAFHAIAVNDTPYRTRSRNNACTEQRSHKQQQSHAQQRRQLNTGVAHTNDTRHASTVSVHLEAVIFELLGDTGAELRVRSLGILKRVWDAQFVPFRAS